MAKNLLFVWRDGRTEGRIEGAKDRGNYEKQTDSNTNGQTESIWQQNEDRGRKDRRFNGNKMEFVKNSDD